MRQVYAIIALIMKSDVHIKKFDVKLFFLPLFFLFSFLLSLKSADAAVGYSCPSTPISGLSRTLVGNKCNIIYTYAAACVKNGTVTTCSCDTGTMFGGTLSGTTCTLTGFYTATPPDSDHTLASVTYSFESANQSFCTGTLMSERLFGVLHSPCVMGGGCNYTCASIPMGGTASCPADNPNLYGYCQIILPPTDNGCAANTCIGSTCNNNITTVQGTKTCDNGCAATTCKSMTCNNSIANVQGTKTCTDNGCAADTCTTATCDNGVEVVQGTKVCIDNGCATNTCTTETCNNGSAIVSGTKTCTDNGCAASTCQASDSGMQTSCDNSFTTVPGTLQASFTPKCIQPAALPTSTARCDSSAAGNCGKTITIQAAGSCSGIDSSGCMNSTACSAAEITACQQQYPAVTRTCPTCKGITTEVKPQMKPNQPI